MKVEEVNIEEVKLNEKNPRVFVKYRFEKLKAGIEKMPEMLKARPLVVNKDMVVLGGNMRLTAARELGIKKIWITKVNWSKKRQDEFIIKDNTDYGEWDISKLSEGWDIDYLEEIGVEEWFGGEDEEKWEQDNDIELICPNCGNIFTANKQELINK